MNDTAILDYLQICLDHAPHGTRHDIVFGPLVAQAGRGDNVRRQLLDAISRDAPNRVQRVKESLLRS